MKLSLSSAANHVLTLSLNRRGYGHLRRYTGTTNTRCYVSPRSPHYTPALCVSNAHGTDHRYEALSQGDRTRSGSGGRGCEGVLFPHDSSRLPVRSTTTPPCPPLLLDYMLPELPSETPVQSFNDVHGTDQHEGLDQRDRKGRESGGRGALFYHGYSLLLYRQLPPPPTPLRRNYTPLNVPHATATAAAAIICEFGRHLSQHQAVDGQVKWNPHPGGVGATEFRSHSRESIYFVGAGSTLSCSRGPTLGRHNSSGTPWANRHVGQPPQQRPPFPQPQPHHLRVGRDRSDPLSRV